MTTNPLFAVGATEQQIDSAARYLRETTQSGKQLTAWYALPKASKKKWLTLASGTLAAAITARSTL